MFLALFTFPSHHFSPCVFFQSLDNNFLFLKFLKQFWFMIFVLLSFLTYFLVILSIFPGSSFLSCLYSCLSLTSIFGATSVIYLFSISFTISSLLPLLPASFPLSLPLSLFLSVLIVGGLQSLHVYFICLFISFFHHFYVFIFFLSPPHSIHFDSLFTPFIELNFVRHSLFFLLILFFVSFVFRFQKLK